MTRYLRRKIDTTLVDWKRSPDRLPLIIKGPRQVGKTASVRHFAAGRYESVIEINFVESPSYRSICDNGYSVQAIIRAISLLNPYHRFIPGKTLIFFDEIQAFPDIATSLKFFREDGRFDVICSGSLLGFRMQQIESVSVGSKTDFIMRALDFEEFGWARGYGEDLVGMIDEHVRDVKPFAQVEMEKCLELFFDYCVLGGMPAVVSNHVAKKGFEGSLAIQRQLLLDYEEDIQKYLKGLDRTRVLGVFRRIPAQLAKENKKFQISKVASGARSREYEGCVEWLENAGMILRCSALAFPELPIRGNEDLSRYKLYFHDTGLLVACLEDEVQGDLRANRNLGVYKGALYENFVASALAAQDYPLCYYKRDVGSLEEDFFVRNADSLIPVEVKAGSNHAKSLKTLIESDHYPDISFGIKFGNANVGFAGRVLTMPWFCAFRLRETLKEFDPDKAEADSSIDT